MAYTEFDGDLDKAEGAEGSFVEFTGELDKPDAKRALPAGVKESTAGAGRGSMADNTPPKAVKPADERALRDPHLGMSAERAAAARARAADAEEARKQDPNYSVLDTPAITQPNETLSGRMTDAEYAANYSSNTKPKPEVRTHDSSRDSIKNTPGPVVAGAAVRRALGNGLPAVAAEGVIGGLSGIAKVVPGLVAGAADVADKVGIPGAEAVRDFSLGQARTADQFGEAVQGNGSGGYYEKLVGNVFASVAQNLPVMAMGMGGTAEMVAGKVVADQAAKTAMNQAMKTLFVQTAGAEYADARNLGFDPAESAARAGIFGAAEVLGERFGFHEQMAVLRASLGKKKLDSHQLSRVLATEVMKEIPGEELTTAIQFLADKYGPAAKSPKATLADYLEQAADTAAQTIGQTLLMGAPASLRNTYQRADAAAAYDSAKLAGLNVNPPFNTDTPDVQRKKTIGIFSAIAAQYGMDPDAVKRATEAAGSMPAADVGPFLARLTTALQKRQLVAKPPEEHAIDALVAGPIDDPKVVDKMAADAEKEAEEKKKAKATRETTGADDDLTGLSEPSTVKSTPSEGSSDVQVRKDERAKQADVQPVSRGVHAGVEKDASADAEAGQTSVDTGALPSSGTARAPGAATVRGLPESEGGAPSPELRSPEGGALAVPGASPSAARGSSASRANPDALSQVDEAAHAAAPSPKNDLPEPTQAQKEAGNYQKGHIKVAGLDISVENPEGSTRSGVSADGTEWSNTVKHHYGYIRGSVGMDKEHVDAFVKPGTTEDHDGTVFVIDQIDPTTGKADEHKVMVGFETEAEARAAYQANYAKGWKGLGAITAAPMADFKEWLRNGDTTKPYGPAQPDVQPTAGQPARGGADGRADAAGSGRAVGQLAPDAGQQRAAPAAAPVASGAAPEPAGTRGGQPGSVASGTKAAPAKAPADIGGVAANAPGDLQQWDAISKKGLDGLDVPARAAVLKHVLSAAADPEIRRLIVERIPIDVVHVLAGPKATAELLLDDVAMLKDLANAGDSESPVALRRERAANALVRVVAKVSAERDAAGRDAAGRASKLDAAVGANVKQVSTPNSIDEPGTAAGRTAAVPPIVTRIIARAGRTPSSAAPLELRQTASGQEVWHGGHQVLDFEEGTPVILPADVTDADALAAVKASGAFSNSTKYFQPQVDKSANPPGDKPAKTQTSDRGSAVSDAFLARKQAEKDAAAAAPAPAPDRDTQDRQGLRQEDRDARKLDSNASELAGQMADDVTGDDFDAAEVMPGLEKWAKDSGLAADDLRQAVLKQLKGMDLTKAQLKKLTDAMDPVKAAAKKPRALPDRQAFARDYAAFAGRDLQITVQLSDTGSEGTLTIPAQQAMRSLDARLKALTELRACIGRSA